MRFAVIAAVGLVLLPIGCGDGDTGDGPKKMSDGSDVWVKGATLPNDYEGCRDGNRVVLAELLDCNDHGGQWTIYQDRLAAVLGGRIQPLPGPPDTESSKSSYLLRC